MDQPSPDADDRQPIQIALFTDTHFWPNGGQFTGGDGNLQPLDASQQLMDALVDALQNNPLDLAIHLGDITCGGGSYHMPATDFEEALLSVRRQLTANTGFPVHALPGNHDCPPGGGLWSRCEALWGLSMAGGKTIDTPYARLILLNLQGHSDAQIRAAGDGDPISGWVSRDELARLNAELAAADRPVILFMHQLLKPWSAVRPWKEFYGIGNGAEILDVMARHGNVHAVFQGHAHMLDVQEVEVGATPCRFVVVPSVIDFPHAWLQLTLSPPLSGHAATLEVEVCQLPLAPELRAATLSAGSGQSWRAGRAEWQQFQIDLGQPG